MFQSLFLRGEDVSQRCPLKPKSIIFHQVIENLNTFQRNAGVLIVWRFVKWPSLLQLSKIVYSPVACTIKVLRS